MRRERLSGWRRELVVGCGAMLLIAAVCIPGVATAGTICDDPSQGTEAVKLLCGGIDRQDRGDVDGSIADFKRALELQPDLTEAHMMLGIGYYDRKEYARALVEYDKYLAVIRGNYHAWSNRAALFLHMGNLVAARADIERALVINPRDLELLENRIVIAREAGDWLTVIGDCTWLLDHYLAKATWLLDRGRALGHESRFTESLVDLQRAVDLSPTAGAYLSLGETRFFLKQYGAAAEDFTRVLGINPNIAAAYLRRCKTRYELQQFREGLPDCDEWVKRRPGDYDGYYTRGILRSRAGDQDGALADYRRAIELAKTARESANAWYGVGLANERAKRIADAREAYSRTLEIDSEYRLAKQALTRISK